MLAAATTPAATQSAEEAKAEVGARFAEAEAQLVAAKAEAPLKSDAAAHAREEAREAEDEKVTAMEASREATRMMSPVSVFISRKTQRLYVRQSFQPVFESPITIRDADHPIGTHIYTVLDYVNGGADFRWSAVSMEQFLDKESAWPKMAWGRRRDGHNAEPMSLDAGPARAALDRIEIRPGHRRPHLEIIAGSSLIISDEGMSPETGNTNTDFVILLNSEPQGGIKMRRHDPEATIVTTVSIMTARIGARRRMRPHLRVAVHLCHGSRSVTERIMAEIDMRKSRDEVQLLAQEDLHRALKDRHVQMIAIGGTIGVGLFLGSAMSIQKAGPGLVVSYAIGGLVMFFIMRALGELLLTGRCLGPLPPMRKSSSGLGRDS